MEDSTRPDATDRGPEDPPELRHVLPVRTSKASDGSQASHVLCPRRGEHVGLRQCGQCAHCLGLTLNVRGIGNVLKCAWRDEAPVADPRRLQPLGPTIGELMTREHCVAATGTSAETVTDRRLHSVMTPNVFGLSADASVGRAAALMAYEGVHELVVFTDDGNIAGTLSSLDLLRWLARSAGFVVPNPS